MNIITLVISAIVLSGCSIFNTGGSSDYACPGMPKGVTCKTPREVYDITGNANSSNGKKSSSSKSKSGFNPGPIEVRQAGLKSDLAPLPVLEQARVMRIWVAPWVDSNKDLHWPGVIFTQVQERQWSIGDGDFNGVEPAVPHRISSGMATLQMKENKTAEKGASDQPVLE